MPATSLILDHAVAAGGSAETDSSPPSRRRQMRDCVAVVTGASSGIGRAIAVALGAEGSAVCLVGRDAGRLAEARSRVEAAGAREVLAARVELTSDDEVLDLVAQAKARFGRVDILVHSAGSYARAPLETATLRDLDALYQANVRAPYRLTQHVLPLLRDARGDVIFVNSTQGTTAGAGVGQFAATQHAMKAIADSLRDEINVAGVRVTVVHVGSTATPRQARIADMVGRPYAPERLLQPEDVGEMVVAMLRLPRTAEVTSLTIRPMQKP